jgi:hypothetical protein
MPSEVSPRELVHWAGSLVIFSALLLWGRGMADGAEEWNHDRLRTFLTDRHAPEAVLISGLSASQAGQVLPLFSPVGHEEVRQGLRERLILARAGTAGPFVRGDEFVLRVERSQALEVRVRLERFGVGAGDRVWREVPPRVRLRLLPSHEERWLEKGPDGFTFTLPAGRVERAAELQVRTRDQSHTLTLTLINLKSPVSWQNPAVP